MYRIMYHCKCKKTCMLVALLLAASYPGFVFNLNRMLSEQTFETLLLLFVFFICKALNTRQKLKWYTLGAITCGAAVFVRGLAFPFAILVITIILFYETENKKRLAFTFGLSFFLTQVWWWIRNFVNFHRFILLSDAGKGPKIWGLMPYYMDMPSSDGLTVSQLIDINKATNFALFIRWKIFGQINLLWHDIWDEELVHPNLRWALWIQLLLILVVILFPIIVKNCNAQILLITSFPVAFTIMQLPYHGLPRYLYPAVPFIFIALAILMTQLSDPKNIIKQSIVQHQKKSIILSLCEKLYFYFLIFFSIFIFIGIFIFSPYIGREMSEWRLNKYAGTSINDINKLGCTWQKNIVHDEIIVENSSNIGKGIYINDNLNTSMIKVTNILPLNNHVITKVDIDISGGYLYDRFVVYWQVPTMPSFDENHVYSIPTHFYQNKYTLYIDGDITSLLILPYTFRGGKFVYQNISISKIIY